MTSTQDLQEVAAKTPDWKPIQFGTLKVGDGLEWNHSSGDLRTAEVTRLYPGEDFCGPLLYLDAPQYERTEDWLRNPYCRVRLKTRASRDTTVRLEPH